MNVKVIARKGRGYVMRWKDPITRKTKESRCSGASLRAAQREAARLEDQLARPTYQQRTISLDEMVKRYRKSRPHCASGAYRCQLDAALKRLRAVADEKRVAITGEAICQSLIDAAIQQLRTEVRPATAASYKGALQAFFNWAADHELCDKIKWRIIETPVEQASGGRALTADEFERLQMAVAAKVGRDRFADFERLMLIMYHGGLRISEAIELNAWRQDCHHTVFTADGRGEIVFLPHQKNRRRQSITMVEPLESLLRSMEPDEAGYYCSVRNSVGQLYASSRPVSRIIAEAGKAAGIETKPGHYARAHDIRRSFAQRYAMKVQPAVLKYLMRHRDIQTTMRYYAHSEGMSRFVSDQLSELGI